MYTGELISLTVAISWTVCAMFAEVASKRMGSLPFNMVRMFFSIAILSVVLWWWTGSPYPVGADSDTWLWLSLSGLVGYVLGDFCLFNSYILIGSRYGQLLMTLAPPAAALFGFVLLGQQMSWLALLGMAITMVGIGMVLLKPLSPLKIGEMEPSAISHQPLHSLKERTYTRGILFGIAAAMGQGIGLVLSAKGLLHYNEIIIASGMDLRNGGETAFVLPFAATAIRAITGLFGFSLWTTAVGELGKFRSALCDGRGMLFAIGAIFTGPVVGVSLSLMATLYTSTGIAQTIMATTPVMILLPTFLFFHQRITLNEVLGAILSVCGVALFFV